MNAGRARAAEPVTSVRESNPATMLARQGALNSGLTERDIRPSPTIASAQPSGSNSTSNSLIRKSRNTSRRPAATVDNGYMAGGCQAGIVDSRPGARYRNIEQVGLGTCENNVERVPPSRPGTVGAGR